MSVRMMRKRERRREKRPIRESSSGGNPDDLHLDEPSLSPQQGQLIFDPWATPGAWRAPGAFDYWDGVDMSSGCYCWWHCKRRASARGSTWPLLPAADPNCSGCHCDLDSDIGVLRWPHSDLHMTSKQPLEEWSGNSMTTTQTEPGFVQEAGKLLHYFKAAVSNQASHAAQLK